MAQSKQKHILSFRRTLMKWRNEILNYFTFRLTNARTEGYNNVAQAINKKKKLWFSLFQKLPTKAAICGSSRLVVGV
jgi:transposase